MTITEVGRVGTVCVTAGAEAVATVVVVTAEATPVKSGNVRRRISVRTPEFGSWT